MSIKGSKDGLFGDHVILPCMGLLTGSLLKMEHGTELYSTSLIYANFFFFSFVFCFF